MCEKLRLSTHQIKIIFHNPYVLLGLSPLISLSPDSQSFPNHSNVTEENSLVIAKEIYFFPPPKRSVCL